MGVVPNRSMQVLLENWAVIIGLVIATAFGVTIFVKNWHYGVIFFLILFFVTIALKKGWFKDKVFHD